MVQGAYQLDSDGLCLKCPSINVTVVANDTKLTASAKVGFSLRYRQIDTYTLNEVHTFHDNIPCLRKKVPNQHYCQARRLTIGCGAVDIDCIYIIAYLH